MLRFAHAWGKHSHRYEQTFGTNCHGETMEQMMALVSSLVASGVEIGEYRYEHEGRKSAPAD